MYRYSNIAISIGGFVASFTDDAARSDHLAEILKALSHSTRLRIVAALCEGSANVGALAARLGLEQAIVSQQLRILRMSGLVSSERIDGFAVYALAEPRLAALVSCLEGCPRHGAKEVR
jgi:DNA-binding transcriptional ArsR family regulator